MPKLLNKIFLAILISFSLSGYSQSSDLEFIQQNTAPSKTFQKRDFIYKSQTNILKKYNPVSLAFGSLLYFYQNVLSQQISADCLYHPSCSEFSKLSIQEYGLMKGIFLSADRITRCNQISAVDIHPLKIDYHIHKASDPVKDYH